MVDVTKSQPEKILANNVKKETDIQDEPTVGQVEGGNNPIYLENTQPIVPDSSNEPNLSSNDANDLPPNQAQPIIENIPSELIAKQEALKDSTLHQGIDNSLKNGNSKDFTKLENILLNKNESN